MNALTTRALILPFCVLSLAVSAQENRPRVCVPAMKNVSGRSISGTMERDRLVSDLNQMKPDKKTHFAVQAVALEGATPDELGDQPKEKKCDYVVYTNLLDLRASSDAMQRTPGTIQTNPIPSPIGRSPGSLNQQYQATVEYRLYRTDGAAISGAPFTNTQSMSEETAVSQLMDRIANQVFAEIKKGGGPPMRE